MSSMPNPHDRARAREAAAEGPFKDAREAMTQQQADLQAEAEGFGEARAGDADAEPASTAQFEAGMAERLADIGDEVARERDREQGRPNR